GVIMELINNAINYFKEVYGNIGNEILDTIAAKDRDEKSLKINSVAFKVLGALLMFAGASSLVGIVTAIPSQGLSLVGLCSAVFLSTLGYDFAQIGHSIRKHFDNTLTAVANSALNGAKNMWNMGIEKGALYTAVALFAQDTIIVSKLSKFLVSFQYEIIERE